MTVQMYTDLHGFSRIGLTHRPSAHWRAHHTSRDRFTPQDEPGADPAEITDAHRLGMTKAFGFIQWV